LVLCYYKYYVSEECLYYSTNRASAITISHLFEGCHYVRETLYRTHLQVYWIKEGGRNVLFALIFNILPSFGFFLSSLAATQTARGGAACGINVGQRIVGRSWATTHWWVGHWDPAPSSWLLALLLRWHTAARE
jgi:hypothetical protein